MLNFNWIRKDYKFNQNTMARFMSCSNFHLFSQNFTTLDFYESKKLHKNF